MFRKQMSGHVQVPCHLQARDPHLDNSLANRESLTPPENNHHVSTTARCLASPSSHARKVASIFGTSGSFIHSGDCILCHSLCA
jgi:hypothetical protein